MDALEIWEKHRPYVELISKVNNSYVFVAEHRKRFLFISPNFLEIYDSLIKGTKDVNEAGLIIDSLIHPDDKVIVESLMKRVFDYVFELPFEKRADYKHIFEFRVEGPAGDYIRVIFQYQMLEAVDPGEPVLLLTVIDIAPNQSPDELMKFRLVNFKTGEIVTFPIIEDKNVNLSRRELEILKMVNGGMFSKEISEKLFISIHTVNRHRQNILQKMNADNITEAISFARKLGLLG